METQAQQLETVRFTRTLEANEGPLRKVHFHQDKVDDSTSYSIEIEVDGFQKRMKFATENDGFGSTVTESEFSEIWDSLKQKGLRFAY